MAEMQQAFAAAHASIPKSVIRSSILSSWFWYRLQEGAGSSVAAVSNGAPPALVPKGAITTEWGNAGYYTPIGSSDASVLYAQNTYFDTFFNFANLNGKQMLLGLDWYYDGGITPSSEHLLGYGANTTAGGWWVNINTSNQLGISYKAVGSSSLGSGTFAGFNLSSDADAGSNTRISLLFDFRVRGVYPNAALTCNLYSNGVSKTSVTNLDINQIANGGTALPGGTTTQPFHLGGRKNSTGSNTYDQVVHSSASNGRLAMVFAMVKSTPDELLPIAAAREFYNLRGEYPDALRAA